MSPNPEYILREREKRGQKIREGIIAEVLALLDAEIERIAEGGCESHFAGLLLMKVREEVAALKGGIPKSFTDDPDWKEKYDQWADEEAEGTPARPEPECGICEHCGDAMHHWESIGENKPERSQYEKNVFECQLCGKWVAIEPFACVVCENPTHLFPDQPRQCEYCFEDGKEEGDAERKHIELTDELAKIQERYEDCPRCAQRGGWVCCKCDGITYFSEGEDTGDDTCKDCAWCDLQDKEAGTGSCCIKDAFSIIDLDQEICELFKKGETR